VASQAIVGGGALRRMRGNPKCPAETKQGESDSRRKKFPCCSRGHAPTRQFFRFTVVRGRIATAVLVLLGQAADIGDQVLDVGVFQLVLVGWHLALTIRDDIGQLRVRLTFDFG